MNGFNQPFNTDKWMKLIKSTNSSCAEHGEYEQRTYLIVIGNREMITKCPTCEALLKESRIKAEVRNLIEGGKLEYHNNLVSKLFDRSGIPPRFVGKTLDNFIETPDNKANLDKIRDFINNISLRLSLGGGLILFGGVGLGKSHLACAIAEAAINKHASALFISASDMVDDVQQGFNDKQSVKAKVFNYTKPDLLIIDEIIANMGEYDIKTISKVINRRYEMKRSTIIITNLSLKSEDKKVRTLASVIGERIIDRLRDTSKAIQFTGESWRGKQC